MNDLVNVGIIGYGLAGRVFHAPLITSIRNFKLVKIITADASRISAVQQRYPGTQTAGAIDSILEDPSISLVIVASPNEFHYEHTLSALLSGKHVVSDKPFTITSAESDELIRLAAEKNLVLTTFQNRRWDSDFLTIKKLLAEKRLGNIVEAEMHYDRFRNFIKPNTWKEELRPGSGILYDLGSHLIDQAQVLFGLPNAVTAFLATQRNFGKTIDNFEIILHYNNLKVLLEAGLLVRAPSPRYIFTGQEGSFVKYGLDLQEQQLSSGMMPGLDEYGIETEATWGKLYYETDGQEAIEVIQSEIGDYTIFYQNVYEAITDGTRLLVDPGEATNLILLDVFLTGYDGRNICKQFKFHPETKNIPIIMVSGHEQISETIIEFGADDFLLKPFKLESLLGKINDHLSKVKNSTFPTA